MLKKKKKKAQELKTAVRNFTTSSPAVPVLGKQLSILYGGVFIQLTFVLHLLPPCCIATSCSGLCSSAKFQLTPLTFSLSLHGLYISCFKTPTALFSLQNLCASRSKAIL